MGHRLGGVSERRASLGRRRAVRRHPVGVSLSLGLRWIRRVASWASSGSRGNVHEHLPARISAPARRGAEARRLPGTSCRCAAVHGVAGMVRVPPRPPRVHAVGRCDGGATHRRVARHALLRSPGDERRARNGLLGVGVGAEPPRWSWRCPELRADHGHGRHDSPQSRAAGGGHRWKSRPVALARRCPIVVTLPALRSGGRRRPSHRDVVASGALRRPAQLWLPGVSGVLLQRRSHPAECVAVSRAVQPTPHGAASAWAAGPRTGVAARPNQSRRRSQTTGGRHGGRHHRCQLLAVPRVSHVRAMAVAAIRAPSAVRAVRAVCRCDRLVPALACSAQRLALCRCAHPDSDRCACSTTRDPADAGAGAAALAASHDGPLPARSASA